MIIMLDKETLKKQLPFCLDKTDLRIGRKYQGKVRDNYILENKRVLVTTDRVSAFDRVLCTIPFKGQVLSQMSGFWFEKTKHIVNNHVISILDPNVMVVKECELIPVEMIVRGYLTGSTNTSAWINYKNGVREYCGHTLPKGMKKNQRLPKPIVTPTTKAEQGQHDELISGKEAVLKGMAGQEIWDALEETALLLYQFGNEYVSKHNLILVDTKYEFGLLDGQIVLIDEIHTPDSSRYWMMDTYDELFKADKEPDKLDKEYIRLFLAEQGFVGDGPVPFIPDDVRVEAARRYIKAYEMITGEEFEAEVGDVGERMKNKLSSLLS